MLAAHEKDASSEESLARKERWRRQTASEMELERRLPYILDQMKGMNEDDVVKAQVAELKRRRKEEYNERVRERGLHRIRELRDGEELQLKPGEEEAIRRQVREDLEVIRAGSEGVFEENENTIRKFVGGTLVDRNLDGADFTGEREFPSSLTRQQDEDIILAAAWDEIVPKNSLESIDECVRRPGAPARLDCARGGARPLTDCVRPAREKNSKLDSSRQVWEQPLLPPGKERDDSVALYEFGVPSLENSLHPVTINGYCPVEVEDPRDYLTFTQLQRRPKELPFQGCEWSLVPSRPKNSEKMRASVRIVF